jgi:tyrosyl-tRNA synthetase
MNERKLEMGVYEELVARGLIAQVTDEKEIRELVNSGKAVFYIGFDPTADSLHVGHFMALCLMKRLQMAGNKPIALIGGGTAMVGDPSGRTDMRQMMTPETIQHNVDCFKKQMSRFIDFSDDKALMVNNADWLMDLNYVDVLRDVGAHFSVNRMLTAECYKQRMEKGLSFLEFNYMIMQSYDFYALYKKYGCNMQFGGDDQWSNMLGGTELIRRKLGKDAYAMTINLLLNSEGKKMGKTQSGAVWLSAEKTSPYDFYQYWRNVDDSDVIKCLKMLTFLSLEEIAEFEKLEGAEINKAKEVLAFELTKLVHGEEEATKAQNTARTVFAGGGKDANMPSTDLTKDELGEGIQILDLLVKCGLISSKGEGRRLITQNGISVNDAKVTDIFLEIKEDDFTDNELVIKKGKKIHHKVNLVDNKVSIGDLI